MTTNLEISEIKNHRTKQIRHQSIREKEKKKKQRTNLRVHVRENLPEIIDRNRTSPKGIIKRGQRRRLGRREPDGRGRRRRRGRKANSFGNLRRRRKVVEYGSLPAHYGRHDLLPPSDRRPLSLSSLSLPLYSLFIKSFQFRIPPTDGSDFSKLIRFKALIRQSLSMYL